MTLKQKPKKSKEAGKLTCCGDLYNTVGSFVEHVPPDPHHYVGGGLGRHDSLAHPIIPKVRLMSRSLRKSVALSLAAFCSRVEECRPLWICICLITDTLGFFHTL